MQERPLKTKCGFCEGGIVTKTYKAIVGVGGGIQRNVTATGQCLSCEGTGLAPMADD